MSLELRIGEGKKDIKSLTLSEVTEELNNLGEKAFRAKQLYQWMHEKLARSYDEMTNVSKALKEKLPENFSYTSLQMVTYQESKISRGSRLCNNGINLW